MREAERVRIMERMREKVRERERRMMEGRDRDQRERKREKELIKKMAFVALNPLHLTIFRLLYSIRVSMDPRSRDFLRFAAYGVNEALQLLVSLEEFRERIESQKMEALEGELREAAWELENALDSHVSDQFVSQSETGEESQVLLYSLNLQGIEQYIDGFVQMVMKMDKLLNPWLQQEEEEDGEEDSGIFGLSNQFEVDEIRIVFPSWMQEKEEEDDEEEEDSDGSGIESDISGLSDQKEEEYSDGGGKESNIMGLSEVDVTKSWFVSWFATKAASVFLGTKEDYIQELENLLPQQEDDDYAVLFTTGRTSDFSRMVSDKRFKKINDDLMIWWINKAAASIFVMERDPLPEDDDDSVAAAVVSSGTESGVNMVGSIHLFCKIRAGLLVDYEKLTVVVILGMAGIGKTALAKKIIQDPLISSNYECCIIVRLGPEFQWEETMRVIVAQMPGGDKMLMEEDVDLDYYVRKTLAHRKCLIVLDDFWNRGPRKIFDIYPEGSSQSAILFTTRTHDAAISARMLSPVRIYAMPFLNNEESWDLLRGKIFGEKRCIPHELEKAGKKIAENCEGLPLLIVTVAGLLSQAETTLEYWSKVAANKTNSIFVDAYKQISEVVYPSYYYLPQHLKACSLYFGAFPQNDEVRVSRLISLWTADGFLGVPYTLLQNHADMLMKEIVFNNVALVTQRSTDHYVLKALTLHSVFWYLCKREAQKEKFLLVLNSYTDASVQGIKSQRRLSIYKNILLSRKDVRDSIASISVVRSLLCMGPYHQYEVPICLGLRLLNVLDALKIRFYEFPIEVMKLVQLRYLSLTCNGSLPPSICNLWGLQCLILHQHQSIKSSSVSHTYLPAEIWDLQDLEHLQIMGRNLPDPPPGTLLRKLLILLDVGANTCTKHVLASIPNLEKLRVQIELMPVAAEPLRFCDDTSHLEELRSLQFVIVNPELMFKSIPPAPSFSFSRFIRKLTLSGFGYPWKDMYKIAALPNLVGMKLKCYAFRGKKWHVKEGEFRCLKYLSIEGTDLVQWTGNFCRLEFLTIKYCYRLLELPRLPSFVSMIRIVDCNPSAVTCAKQMAHAHCSVYIESSWLDDGKRS